MLRLVLGTVLLVELAAWLLGGRAAEFWAVPLV
jgi:hypothetical protein